jgi:aminoglycoside phosphotransferase (APT) family kinase protein
MELLTPQSLAGYLRSKGWIDPSSTPKIAPVAGGVSCHLFKIETKARKFIIKQALEKLEVAADWHSDPSRIFQEIDCLEWIVRYIDASVVPRVLGRDDGNFLFLMECAADASENWKQQLLRGEVDPGFAERIGGFLGQLHTRTQGDPWIERRFADQSRFDELRLDAYLRFTARKHADLAEHFDEEIKTLSSARVCLVHGDFTPKNFLVLPGGGFWVLDWEVSHFGHPVFDVASFLNHLLIKSLFLPQYRENFFEAARMFWAAYRAKSTLVTFPHLSRMTGMLMLARVDGKSPVEYVKTEELKARLRGMARNLILHPAPNLEELLQCV